MVMSSEPLKEEERSPPPTAPATAAASRPKTSGGRKPMKAKRNPELSRENSEEASKVTNHLKENYPKMTVNNQRWGW